MPCRRRLLSRRPAAVTALLSLLLLAGCSDGEKKASAPAGGKPPVPVRLGTVERHNVPVELQAFGSVEAKASVPVKARVAGQVRQVHFREGQEVARGELLFTIDPQPFELALQQAEAALARDLAQQRTVRDKAERYRQLLAQGFISRQEHDQVQGDAAALDAVLRLDRAAVDSARLQLDYCRIRSPLAGRTGSQLVHPGALVKANEGEALVVIHQLAPISVSFTVPEPQLATLRQALAARRLEVAASIDGDGAPPEHGTLDFIDNAVDAATGTIRLKATFANTERRLWPGQFVRVGLTVANLENALTVPAAAVQTGQKGPYLFVVVDGSAELRPVQTGPTWQGMTVISEGVKAGDTVVTDGQMRLYPGARVASSGKENKAQGSPGMKSP